MVTNDCNVKHGQCPTKHFEQEGLHNCEMTYGYHKTY